MQLLSSHIKLLLDAPEHLWKIIERGSYFEAAWLFLLARLVHRSLIRDEDDEDEDEDSWTREGIDVLVCEGIIMSKCLSLTYPQDQFPLVQRQWEAISHFRTQIVHRATSSLRDYVLTPEVKTSRFTPDQADLARRALVQPCLPCIYWTPSH